jgi:two-component system chemotaxis response regulator CheB
MHNYKAIVIGVSAGGLHALGQILPRLPADFPLPVIIVQHISPQSDSFMIRHFNSISMLAVKEADEKEEILPGTIYFAPPNYHLIVENDFTFSLSVDERVNFSRPSIDVLFETAAEAYVETLIGIILTGANNDGSRGLKRIKDFGGFTIVQNPATSEVSAMPEAAIKIAKVDKILDLEKIAGVLMKLSQ